MEPQSLAERIERELAEQAGINAIVEEDGGTLILSGSVDSPEARQAAEDIAGSIAPDRPIDNNLDLDQVLSDRAEELSSDESSLSELALGVDEVRDLGGEIEPDFTDQEILTDPIAASGPSSNALDPASEGDEVYVPPTDPVVTSNEQGELEVLGGFTPTSTTSVEVERSAQDNRLGDEAIADAVRRELREDASTTELRVRVVVREGVVHLRGAVDGLEDAENAESVAGRVPGVREVVEELDVAELGGL